MVVGKVVALAGGVGGAKLADGLAQMLPAEKLTVVVNTGDDFVHLGLYICPDLDTVCYTLAGLANPQTGWGRVGESWQALETLSQLGAPTWFRLGDRDLALHLERTRRLSAGEPLSQITQHVCRSFGVQVKVLPMCDHPTPTRVLTDEGELPFQEYFVHRRCQPKVRGFRFEGVEQAQPAPGVLQAIEEADIVVICPSNPWVSIDPILSVPGIRPALEKRKVIAVSPIIGGQVVKGPAAKMFSELGIQPSALAVARFYAGLLTGFVMDFQDAEFQSSVEQMGVRVLLTETIMRVSEDRKRLAGTILEFVETW